MKVMIFYRDASEHGQAVREFLREFHRITGRTIDEISPDSPDGIQRAEVYDIVEYPTLLAIDDNGTMQNMWSGLPLPTISEVSYYA
jgi:hypothetical protein